MAISAPRASSASTAPTLLALIELELRYFLRSGVATVLAVVSAVSGVGSAMGLVSASTAKARVFERTLAEAIAAGDTLTAALSRPVHVTADDGGGLLVDNPLRYDFEQAQAAVSALHVLGFSINTMQLLMLLTLPLTATLLALTLVTRDYRLRTLKVRCSRASFRAIHASQFFATLCALVLGSGLAILAAAITGTVLAGSFQWPGEIVPLPGADTATWVELAKTAALGLGSAAFFTVVGWGAGLAIRQALIPAIAFVIWDLACPLLGAFDPRTLWLVAARSTFTFRGSFELPPMPAVNGWAVLVSLVAMAVALLAAGGAVSGRASRYT